MKEVNRSPIKDPPLRQPGDSLLEERDRIQDDKLEPALLFAVFITVLTLLEWYRFFVPTPPLPWLYTVITVAAIAFAAYRVLKYWPTMRALRQGRDGEVVVGQFLERLRERGYQFFHDVRGANFNVDHVLIGPTGVYTIETKTLSKPVRGGARIRFEGANVIVGSFKLDRDPIVQAKAQSSWIRSLLEEGTGKRLLTRPVIVYPGWFVERAPSALKDVWVLEPKALPSFLENEQPILTLEEVKMASFHLSRIIRADHREDKRTNGRWNRTKAFTAPTRSPRE